MDLMVAGLMQQGRANGMGGVYLTMHTPHWVTVEWPFYEASDLPRGQLPPYSPA